VERTVRGAGPREDSDREGVRVSRRRWGRVEGHARGQCQSARGDSQRIRHGGHVWKHTAAGREGGRGKRAVSGFAGRFARARRPDTVLNVSIPNANTHRRGERACLSRAIKTETPPTGEQVHIASGRDGLKNPLARKIAR